MRGLAGNPRGRTETVTDTIGVHGFQYDPKDSKGAAITLWPLWAEICRPIGGFLGLGWYSYPVGPKAVWRAWKGGHWNRYYAAWADTSVAAGRLGQLIRQHGECNLMAHSLGSRVVLLALEREPNLPVKKVLLISGADSADHALKVGPGLKCQVTNIVVPEDDVLDKLGEWFTPELGQENVIGRTMMGKKIGPHWKDVKLPKRKADDHWDAYRDPRNWEVLRAALT